MIRLSIFYSIYMAFAVTGLTWLTGDIGFINLTGQTVLGDHLVLKSALFSVGTTYACQFALQALTGDYAGQERGVFAPFYGLVAGTTLATTMIFWPAISRPEMMTVVGGLFIVLPFLAMLTAWNQSWRMNVGLPV